MRVVLLELPHAGQAGEHAGRLIAVQHVLGVIAQRQLAVAALLHLVHQVMRRAVHRLERKVVLAALRVEHQEHVLLVLAPVPAPLPEELVVHERGLDLLVAVAQAHLTHRVTQGMKEQRPAMGPEGRPRRRWVKSE